MAFDLDGRFAKRCPWAPLGGPWSQGPQSSPGALLAHDRRTIGPLYTHTHTHTLPIHRLSGYYLVDPEATLLCSQTWVGSLSASLAGTILEAAATTVSTFAMERK